MDCIIDGCNKPSRNVKKAEACEMHYIRKYRYGTYEKTRKRKYRQTHPSGYHKLNEPSHPLADSSGYVYEHRFVMYNHLGGAVNKCSLCGVELTWGSCHVDHINFDVSDNRIDNLRCTCVSCNVGRTNRRPEHEYDNHHCIEYNGIKNTAYGWASHPDVDVCGSTIIRRLRCGMTAEEALFSPKQTHNSK